MGYEKKIDSKRKSGQALLRKAKKKNKNKKKRVPEITEN